MMKSLATVLSCGVCVVAIATPASAQVRAFNIPAGNLKAALDIYGRQSGRPIIYDADQVRGIQTAGISGAMAPEQALDTLLAGTSFHVQRDGNGAQAVVGGGRGTAAGTGAPTSLAEAASAESAQGNDIVVTAQKREERLQKVPMSISVLGGKALDRQPQGGALEALGEVAGIAFAKQGIGNATAIAIRGVAPGSAFLDGSPTVGYYLDSLPYSLVKSSNVPNTDAYDMARVEVLRGPQGTLYGASALNGVVRVITNDADPTHFEFKARAGASTTQGGTGSYRGDAEVNVPVVAEKLAVRVVGGIERLGGWINQPVRGKKDVNKSISRSLRLKLDARPTDNLKIDLTAWFSHERDDAAPYADEANNQYTPLATPQSVTFSAYNAKIAYDLPFMSVSSATSYLSLRTTSYVDYSYVSPISQLYSDLPAKTFAEELLLNSKGDGPWRWSGGAFYRDAHDDLNQTLPPVLSGPINWRDTSRSYAVFGQITRTFADDHFEISGGLRYFHDKVGVETLDTAGGILAPLKHTSYFHAVTPRIVATWLPSPTLTIYASYSQGFRSGFNQSPLALLAAPGLPPVQADKLHNYEIGAKGSLLDGLLTYDAALYYIKWKGVQQSGQIVYNGVIIGASINGSSASGVGTDISLTLHPARGLELGGSLSYNGLSQDEAVLSQGVVLYAKGARLAYSAAYTANAFARYAFALTAGLDAHLNIAANYKSVQRFAFLPGTQAVSLATGRPLLVNANVEIANHRNQSVSLYVNNLTNWNGLIQPGPPGIMTPTSPLVGAATAAFRTRPRSFGIQFETKF